jgi:hypothetical protein
MSYDGMKLPAALLSLSARDWLHSCGVGRPSQMPERRHRALSSSSSLARLGSTCAIAESKDLTVRVKPAKKYFYDERIRTAVSTYGYQTENTRKVLRV